MSQSTLATVLEDVAVADITASSFDRGVVPDLRAETDRADAAESESARLAMEVSPLKTEMMQLNAELIVSKTGIESPSAASLFLAMEAARYTHVRAVRLYPDWEFSLDDRNDEDARRAMASIAARKLRITA